MKSKSESKTLVRHALSISGSSVSLQLITGCGHLGYKSLSDRVVAELKRFIRRAPADEAELDRYTGLEQLHGCIRILRRGNGNNALRLLAFRNGLVLSSHVLTPPYVVARTGFAAPTRTPKTKAGNKWNGGEYPPHDDELGPDDPGPTVETALAIMVEASRELRRGPEAPPPAEIWAYTGIGGDDPSDHAVGFSKGDCAWSKHNAQIARVAPETRAKRQPLMFGRGGSK